VPTTAYKRRIYPRYAAGPAYLLGRRVPSMLIDQAVQFNFITVEDVFFTGLLAESAKIPKTHFNCLLTENCNLMKCNRKVIVAHGCVKNDSSIF
jgi:beta-1,3-galactosyltransferase 1